MYPTAPSCQTVSVTNGPTSEDPSEGIKVVSLKHSTVSTTQWAQNLLTSVLSSNSFNILYADRPQVGVRALPWFSLPALSITLSHLVISQVLGEGGMK